MKSDWKNEKYYYFADDLAKYPAAWCYVVYSRRGPGKTYSALRYAYEQKIPIFYLKRTKDDVDLICTGATRGVDLSPYKPICRDTDYRIEAKLITKSGFGAFYDHFDNETGEPIGAPFSYCGALNAMKSIKGFDLSICDWLLLDEFIPQAGEIVKRREGEMVLDMYMTLARDRQLRGRGDLKLILFANAENISTPITNELAIVDDIAELSASGETHLYLEDRGIMIHHITDQEYPIQEEQKSGIYKGMAGTPWFEKAFGGEFANNDFSNVGRVNLKNYQPLTGWTYKKKECYIYTKDGRYFFTGSKSNSIELYDLNRENDQKRFYRDFVVDLRVACSENLCVFQKYTFYDLLVNYKQFFKL